MENENVIKIFSLLDSLQNSTGDATVGHELINLVRLFGAGAKGVRGTIFYEVKNEFDKSSDLKEKLIEYTKSKNEDVRSWAGSFIEQLFSKREASDILSEMIECESSAYSASWLCLNLARINSGGTNKRVCNLIEKTYLKFEKYELASLQIARAWGYAGCKKALCVLKKYLTDGGYDQTITALDGLIGCYPIDDIEVIDALWQVFNTTKFSEVRERTANVLSLTDLKYHRDIIKTFLTIISSQKGDIGIQKIAISTLGEFKIGTQIANEIQDDLIKILIDSEQEIIPQTINLLNKYYNNWVNKVVKLIMQSEKSYEVKKLAHAISIDNSTRLIAVNLLNSYLDTNDESTKTRVTDVLKELGGTEAFETLSSILDKRYIEPSEKLHEVSRMAFEETVWRMRKNYSTTLSMNKIVFSIGLLIILLGIVLIIVDKANLLFGTAGVIAGLTTLVSLFFSGTIKGVQKSLTEIVQVEVAYLSFMHRLLQARSIFENHYLSKQITIESLEKFDKLFCDNMQSTITLLEK
jgi:hypothetical protein